MRVGRNRNLSWLPWMFFALGGVTYVWTRRPKIAEPLPDELKPDAYAKDPMGQIVEPAPDRDEVDEASWESFPASDPPAWIQGGTRDIHRA